MQKSPLVYLDKIPMSLVALDRGGTITWISHHFLQQYPTIPRDALKRHFDSIFKIKYNDQVVPFSSLMNVSRILEVKFNNNTSLGWFKIHRIPWKTNEFHEIILFSDISEYINDIKERVNSELNYQTIFQNAPYSNVLLRLDGIVLDCNQKTSEIFELPIHEMIGRSYVDLIDITTERYNFYEDLAEQIRNGLEIKSFPTEIDTVNGNHKILEIFPSLIRKSNEPNAIHLIIHDLTEEKKTEQKLSESITVFAAFMENFSGVAFIKSPEGKYIYLNKTLQKLIGNLPYEEYLSKTDFDLFPLEDAKQFRRNDLQVLNTETATQLTETTHTNDILRFWLVNKFPIANKGERPWAVAGMGVDITEQHDSEFLLTIQRDFGLSLNKVKDADELFRLCLNSAMKIPEIDIIGVYLRNPKTHMFELSYYDGPNLDFAEKVKFNPFRVKGRFILEDRQSIYRDFQHIKKVSNQDLLHEGIKSYAIIPLIIGEEVIGAFNVASCNHESISRQTGNILELISSQLGATLAKIQAQEKIKLNEKRLEVLLELNQMTEASENEIFDFALEKGVKLTNSTHGFIVHVNDEQNQITQIRIWSIHSQNVPPVYEFPDENQHILDLPPWSELVQSKKPLTINNQVEMGSEYQLFPSIPREIFRYIAVPVLIQNRIFAIAGVWNKNEYYEESDINQLTLLIEAVASLIRKKQGEEQRELYRQQLEKTVDQITLNEQRLEALLKLNQMTNASEEEIYDCVLQEGVKLTRSENGLLSFVSADGKMKSMKLWSKDFSGPPRSFKMPEQYQDLDKGVWIEVIHAKQPVIVNDVTKSEIAQRLLHPERLIHRYMLIPVFIRGRLFAVAGLGNKPEDYNDSDVKQIQLLIDSVTTLIQKKQDEEQHEFYRRELEKSEKINALGILAGGIAHDFNNILTAILGNISLAELSNNPDEIQNRLTEAKKAILRSKELTQQLLTFAKGGSPIKKLSIIDQLLRDTADFAIRGSNVRVIYNIAEDLWAVEIDEGQISQVINNLVLNSIQAMPKGGTITIKANNKIIREDSKLPLIPGNYIVFKVKDEGIGIPEKYLDQIFDPYFTTKEAGSGLGLATSFAIVTKHGGYITVKSTIGVGSTFSVFIPAISNKKPLEVKMHDTLVYGSGRILLMDDEEIIRKVAKRMLEKLGYSVVTTKNGNETIEIYEEAMKSGELFNLVILDLTIPAGMGGKETVMELRKLDPDLKAIVSSGYSVDPIMSEFKQHGFDGIIAKPYKIEDFSKVIHVVLNKK